MAHESEAEAEYWMELQSSDGFFQFLTAEEVYPRSFPDERFYIFPYIAEARSLALGATSTGGVFAGSEINLFGEPFNYRKPTAPYLYLVGFQKLTLLGAKTLLFPDDRFEIFSYAAEAKSKALGTMPTGGVFTSFTNLQSNQQYGPEHIYHSGQFRASMATRYRYWQDVMTAADLTPYNP